MLMVFRFDASHPIAALKGSDNIISFYTKRYGANPLIIQGAGYVDILFNLLVLDAMLTTGSAGGEVTAMGVTGDLIKVLNLLR